MAPPVDEGPPLGPEWSAHWSEEQNRFYYYNANTQESVWIRPEPVSKAAEPPVNVNKSVIDVLPGEKSKETGATTVANGKGKKLDSETQSEETKKRPLDKTSGLAEAKNGVAKRARDNSTTLAVGMVENRTKGGNETTELSREQVSHELNSIDAIMNPKTIDLIRSLLEESAPEASSEENGEQKAKQIMDSLSSSYVGYADLCNVVTDWLQSIPASQRQQQRTMLNAETDVDPTEQFLIEHVMNMILQRFSANHLAGGVTGSDPPAWLISMLKFKQWRHMLVQLAGQHKNVPLLDFAIKAMSEAGFHQEVGKVPNASSFFSVYKSIYTDILCQFAHSDASQARTQSLYKSLLDLKQLAGHSQYTYLFSLDVLSSLERNSLVSAEKNPAESPQYSDTPAAAEDLPFGLRFVMRRLKQELLMMSASAKDPAVRDGMELFNPMKRAEIGGSGSSSLQPEVQVIVEQVMEKRRFLPEEMTRLRSVFDNSTDSPLWVLRQHNVLAILVGQLFQPYAPLTESMRRDGAYLLAMACGYEGPTAAAIAKASGKPDPVEKLQELQKAILRALEVCNSEHTLSPEGLHPQAPGMVAIQKLMEEHPPISAGVLTWVLACLSSAKFLKGSAYSQGLPTLLHLVRVAAKCHPLQRRQAFFLIKSAFESSTASAKHNKLRRTMLNEMVYLMELGYTVPVLDYVTFLSKSGCDFSLLRHFVAKLVKTAGPPFSRKFCEVSLGLLNSPTCRKAVSSNLQLSRDVTEFRKHCTNSIQNLSKGPNTTPSAKTGLEDTPKASNGTASNTKKDHLKLKVNNAAAGIPSASVQLGSAVIRLVPFSNGATK